jgi:hyperosmotically inducible periplasmic protein
MKISHSMRMGVALVLGAVLMAGPSIAAGTTGESTPIHDSWLTAKAKIALFADSRVKGRQIDVETTKGEVMLRGKVDSAGSRQAAEEITKGLDGVKGVKNDLQVVAPATREVVDDRDEAITARVQEHVAKEPALKRTDISVQTNAGVVSLTGEVPDLMTSAQASWTAWSVPGVKSVTNDLTVQEKS